ncbi:hypothetical protein GCM10017557_43970 [Streptomyces aurantiacus]|uniref:Uncharacterized protein n=1 Tax=Streptomyces aurantiacus TaxID=47760 RepID=A0A7G1P2A1_9ACTN|nr:hypothetical protein GCM10017557_43970 [Streptomyces aurantiacus]
MAWGFNLERVTRIELGSQLGKLRLFVVGKVAGLCERLGVRPVAPGCFHRDSPLFPAQSGALVVRACVIPRFGRTYRFCAL